MSVKVHLCKCSNCGHTQYVLKNGHHDCDICVHLTGTMEPVE